MNDSTCLNVDANSSIDCVDIGVGIVCGVTSFLDASDTDINIDPKEGKASFWVKSDTRWQIAAPSEWDDGDPINLVYAQRPGKTTIDIETTANGGIDREEQITFSNASGLTLTINIKQEGEREAFMTADNDPVIDVNDEQLLTKK